MTRDVLTGYLSRAVTCGSLIDSNTQADDLRLLKRIGAKFLGRAADYWHHKPDEPHFAACRALAERVHAQDTDVIIQGCIFEAIYPGVETTPVPAWVFEAFNLPVEKRNFRFSEIVGPVFGGVYHWDKSEGSADGGTVPDITQREAQLWFYYRARRYLEAGFEALHMGQVHMYGGRDAGYAECATLFGMIREMATKVARRGFVLLDAHTHGIVIDGKLLFDFHSRPISARNLHEKPEQIVLVQRGRSMGGITPSGWTCDEAPTLIEVDNWGGYSMPVEKFGDTALRARTNRWGYDDIAWLAHQPREVRDHFITYAHRFYALGHADTFFQMPVRRTLSRATVTIDGHQAKFYKANMPSIACADGFGQEDVIAQLWSDGRTRPALPVEQPGSYRVEATGQIAPAVVTITGPLQMVLGGVPGDASCPWSRMVHVGGGRFEKVVVVPWAGAHEFAIACGGTMTEAYRAGGLQGGPMHVLKTTADNALVRITFDYGTKSVSIVPV